jgi:hypothetical protein
VPYTNAWRLAAAQRPQCSFWFYTRSFLHADLFAALTQLSSLSNCQGWLSIDSDNFRSGLLAYAKYPGIWKLALLQEDEHQLHRRLLPALEQQLGQQPSQQRGQQLAQRLRQPLVVRFHVSASCALTKRAINTVLPIEHDWFFVEFGDVLFQA